MHKRPHHKPLLRSSRQNNARSKSVRKTRSKTTPRSKSIHTRSRLHRVISAVSPSPHSNDNLSTSAHSSNCLTTPRRSLTSSAQFHHYGELSDLDDLYGDISTSPPQLTSHLAQTSSQQPLSTQTTRPISQTTLPMTIYNVISGINPNPVGVTVFRLSGPHAFQILSLLSRTPLTVLKKRSERRVFTSTIYNIPHNDQQLQELGLIRDDSVDLSLTPLVPPNTQLNQDNINDQAQSGHEFDDGLDFGDFNSLPSNRRTRKDRAAAQPRSRAAFQAPTQVWSNDALFNTIPPQLHHTRSNTQNTTHGRSCENTSTKNPEHTNGVHISDDIIDLEAMIVAFHGPKSFTGEDTVELHVHGNPIIVKEIFTQLNKLSAARVAKNGEFIQRAYMNNRLSLLQVESYYDLLHSRSTAELAHTNRSSQMNKDVQHIYNKWRHVLIESLAYLESIIDFGEDEGDIDQEEILKYVFPQVNAIRQDIYTLLQRKTRETITNGISVSILGAPNVGKSSLLNKITGRQMAIVSAIPGTTRDIVSTSLDIDGLPVQIHDTAGIRDTVDIVEWEGVRRATELSKGVDYKIVLFDATPLSSLFHDILGKKYAINSYQQFAKKQQGFHQNGQVVELPGSQNGLNKDTIKLTPIDIDLAQIINQTLKTQHNSIQSLFSPQTLLIWTKCDTLPFTEFTVFNTMSSQPTSDPIYLQKQTVHRESMNKRNNDQIQHDLVQLHQVLAANQQVRDGTEPEGGIKTIQNDQIDKDALFYDLSSQIMSERSMSYNQTGTSQDGRDNNSNKLLKSIPLANYLSDLSKHSLLLQKHHDRLKTESPRSNQGNTQASPQPALYHDILCVSSRFNHNITEVSAAIHAFAKQSASDSLSKLTPPAQFTSDQSPAAEYVDQVSLSNLFIKHDITLSTRHRQSLLSCYDELSAFLTQLRVDSNTSTIPHDVDHGSDSIDPIRAQLEHLQHRSKLEGGQIDQDDLMSSMEAIKQKNAKRPMPKRDRDLVLSAASLRNAVNAIAEIDGQGEVHAEEVLDAVFNRFCIGK